MALHLSPYRHYERYSRSSLAYPGACTTSMSTLLSSLSKVLNREPSVFIEAVTKCCTLERGSSGDTLVALKKPREAKEEPKAAAGERNIGSQICCDHIAVLVNQAEHTTPQIPSYKVFKIIFNGLF